MAQNNQNQNKDKGSNRGFASMNADQQRDIASRGGKAAHEKGTAHKFDTQEGQEAGSKGGKASHGNRQQSDNSDSREGRDDLEDSY